MTMSFHFMRPKTFLRILGLMLAAAGWQVAAAEAVIRIPQAARDLISLPGQNYVWASVAENAPTNANSLVPLGAGRVPGKILTGGNPTLMTHATGTEIYVVKDPAGRAKSIERISASSGAVLSTVPYTGEIIDLEAMPGRPEVLAITFRHGGQWTTWLYDGTAARSSHVSNVGFIEWDDSGQYLYGRRSRELHRFAAQPETGLVPDLFARTPAYGDLVFFDNLLYLPTRQVFDAATLTELSPFDNLTRALDPLIALSRDGSELAFLSHNTAVWSLQVYDRAGGQKISHIEFPPIWTPMTRLVSYGARSYACKNETDVFLVPRADPTDIGVTFSAPPTATAGEPFTTSIVVTNRGAAADDVLVEWAFSGNASITGTAASSTGTVTQLFPTGLLWKIPRMEAGASIGLQIGISPAGFGPLPFVTLASSRQRDTDPANNKSRHTVEVRISPSAPYAFTDILGPGSWRYGFPADFAGYSSPTGLVGVISGPPFPDFSEVSPTYNVYPKVQYVDPVTGEFRHAVELPDLFLGPQRIAMASNGDAFVAMAQSGTVQQIRADGTLGWQASYSPTNYAVLQLIPRPGHPREVVVRTQFALALFRDGVRVNSFFDSGEFIFNANGLEGYRIQQGTFSRVIIEPAGLRITQHHALSGHALGRLSFAAGKIFTAAGSIIDAATGTLQGSVPAFGEVVGQVVAVAADNKVYMLHHNHSRWMLTAFDAETLAVVGQTPVPVPGAVPIHFMASAGPNRVVFHAGDRMIIAFTERFLIPNLKVEQSVVIEEKQPVSGIVATITASTTQGTASDVQVTINASNVQALTGQTAHGTLTQVSGGWRWDIGPLSAGAPASLQIRADAIQPGVVTLVSTATMSGPDGDPANNVARSSVFAHGMASGYLTALNVQAEDLAWEARSGDLLLALSADQGQPALAAYDPFDGRFGPPVSLPWPAIAMTSQPQSNSVLLASAPPLKVLAYRPEIGSKVGLETVIPHTVREFINVPGETNVWLLPFQSAPGAAVSAHGRDFRAFEEPGQFGGSHSGNIYHLSSTGGLLKWLAMSSTGLVVKAVSQADFSDVPFAVLGNRVYFANGVVLNGDTGAFVGAVPSGFRASIAVDPASRRLYYTSHDFQQWTLRVYDAETLGAIATLKLPGTLPDAPLKLVALGDRGAAFKTVTKQVFIARVPSPLEAPLSLGISPLSFAMTLENQVRLNFTITNSSQVVARNVRFDVTLPDSFSFVTGQVGNAHCTLSNGLVTCMIPEVPAETVLRPFIDVIPGALGSFPVTARIESSEVPDPTTDDNEATLQFEVKDIPWLFITDMVLREGQNLQIFARLEYPVGHNVTTIGEFRLLTATAADFQSTPPRPITIIAGTQTPATFSALVGARQDNLIEGDEFFELVFSQANGARLFRTNVLYRIMDANAPGLFVPDVEFTENDTPETVLNIPVFLSFPLTNTARVRYSTVSATALPGEDYFHQEGMVEFAPGSVSNSIPITVLGNDLEDATRSFGLVFFDAESASIIKSHATIVIRDDDTEGTQSLLMMSSAYTRDGEFQLSFPTQLGRNYVLEYTSLLKPGEWQQAEPIDGNGHIVFRSIRLEGKTNSYFRVRALE